MTKEDLYKDIRENNKSITVCKGCSHFKLDTNNNPICNFNGQYIDPCYALIKILDETP